jgi:vanillate O-demethylase monooxygenase subunit
VFLRNTWYVAGFGRDLEPSKLIARTFLGERVVMYRKTDGTPAALQDRCPHRFVPLHIGKVKGDGVQCGYHGLEFGADGVCAHNPHGDGRIAANMRVNSYPLVEADGILWIWMGEAEKADPATIVRFPRWLNPAYVGVFGYMHVEANYQLINDNLLDLSHIQYVHPIFQRSEADAEEKPAVEEFGETDGVIWSHVENHNRTPLPFGRMFDSRPRVDARTDTFWHAPSLVHLDISLREPGSARGEGDDVEFPSLHLLTPETEGSTHYFWTMLRNVKLDDEGLSSKIRGGLEQAFANEDKPVIEMQQRELGDADLMGLKPVLLQTDSTAVRARRVLQGLLEAEQRAPVAAE